MPATALQQYVPGSKNHAAVQNRFEEVRRQSLEMVAHYTDEKNYFADSALESSKIESNPTEGVQ